MSRILVAALPGDQPTADSIIEAFSGYGLPVAPLVENGPRAEQQLASAAAVIIIISPDWFEALREHEAHHRAITAALSRSDLMIHLALLEGASLPEVTHFADNLRPLAYMQYTTVTEAGFARDVRQIAVLVNQHLKRLDTTRRQQAGAESSRARPWHLFIIFAALFTGLVFVIIPDLQQTAEPVQIATQPPPRSSAANSAIINRQDGLHLGVAAGLSEGVEARGETLVKGVELALHNRPDVTVDGQTFAIDILAQDTACSSDGGLVAAELFASDPGVAGVIGPMCNASCFSSRGIYDRATFTVISPGCDAPELAAGTSFNRTVPNALSGVSGAAAFTLDELGFEQVVVIHDEDPLGTQIADAFAAAFEGGGGQVIAQITLSPELTEDDIRQQIEDDEPQMVFYGGHADEAVEIAEIIGDVPMMLGHSTDMDEFIAELGEDADRSYTYGLLPPSGDDIDELAGQYATEYDTEPAGPVFAYAYDATNILLDGVEAVGRVDVIGNLIVDRAALQDYVREYSGEGVTGMLDCDGTGDCATGEVAIYQIRDGKPVDYNRSD